MYYNTEMHIAHITILQFYCQLCVKKGEKGGHIVSHGSIQKQIHFTVLQNLKMSYYPLKEFF
jgi:hypothetical protein